MHPYRGGPAHVVEDDSDVRAFAAQTRLAQRRTRAAVVVVGAVLAFAMFDWTATAEILCGRAIGVFVSRW